jgi:SAM-dependent methyltransferase
MEISAPSSSPQDRLQAWFSCSLGREVLAAERARLEQVLPDLFGYHALQVGSLGGVDLLVSSRIRHRVIVGAPRSPVQIYAQPEALPITSDSLDVLLLPHTLEFCRDPHRVLREADRTLIAEGHVVILGFNPWSLWGLRRRLMGRNDPPWCGRFLGVARLKDWLGLLGFDTLSVETFFFRPPLGREGIMRRLNSLERLGGRGWPIPAGVYLLTARKRVVALTPIRPRWRPRRSVIAAAVEIWHADGDGSWMSE